MASHFKPWSAYTCHQVMPAHPLLACGPAPEGHARWTLKLLAQRMVELEIVDSIGPECVRTTLKKTNSSPG